MNSGKPKKYLALAESIRLLTSEKHLQKGDALPSERLLAKAFECNHLTIRKALHLLEQENFIHKIPSRGNYLGPAAKRSEPGIVGFLFPDHELYYYELFAELEKSLQPLNLHPIVHLTGSASPREEEIISFMESINGAAVITVPNPQCIELYRKAKIPIIFFDLKLKNCLRPSVISDDYQGAFDAVKYLIAIGHRKIGHISASGDGTGELRLHGYLDALKQSNISLRSDWVICQAPSREGGFYAAQKMLSKADRPQAIFCGNDTIGAGVVRYCAGVNLKIPNDLSVVSFGDTAIAVDLNLTSVNQHPDKIAAALRETLRKITCRSEVGNTIIPTSLTLRGSCR